MWSGEELSGVDRVGEGQSTTKRMKWPRDLQLRPLVTTDPLNVVAFISPAESTHHRVLLSLPPWGWSY